MSFSAGVWTWTTSGLPVVTGTTISSTVKNTQDTEAGTGFSTCLLKDGTQTVTANIPMGGFGFTRLATVAGDVVATQANQETGTAVTLVVTPGRQQFHPSAAKGWVKANATGGSAASYNLASLTDTGTGQVTITWNVDFSGIEYGIAVTTQNDPSTTATTLVAAVDNTGSAPAAGTTRIDVNRVSDGALTDPTYAYCVVFGDQ